MVNRVIAWVVWIYLAFVCAVWLLMLFAGDRWWPASLILFGPRWLLLTPLIVLIPLSLLMNRRLLIPLLAGGVIVAGPFMGFSIPITKVQAEAGEPVLRVLTCNLNAGRFSREALSELIRDSRADIVALQECPRDLGIEPPDGWQKVREGELSIWSRYPLTKGDTYQAFHPPHKWPRTCLLSSRVKTEVGNVTFCTVHLPSPRYGLLNTLDRSTFVSLSRKGLLEQETLNRKRTAREVAQAIRGLATPVIVAGDFNMTADSPLYRDTWEGFENAFSLAGFGYGWTERAAHRGIDLGVRIDHVLVGKEFGIAYSEVGPEIGSDHLPVIAGILMRPH